MELNSTTTYSGPNIYCQLPIVRVVFNELEEPAPAYVEQSVLDEIFAQLPGMQKHLESCAATSVEGGFSTVHLFEHVCIELQQLTGQGVKCVCARAQGSDQIDLSAAVLTYEEPEACIDAASLAATLITHCAPGEATADADAEGSANFAKELDAFITRAQRHMLPVQDRALARTARERGIPVMRLVGRILVLGQGLYQKRMSATKTSHTNAVSNDLAANKDYARRLLGDVGLPIPRYSRVYRSRAARAAAKELGYPVVVKPNNGQMGRGVSVGLVNPGEVRAAYRLARKYDRSVLVEEVVQGNDYRMLVIDGNLCAASHRVPAHIVGDGLQSVQALIDETNSDPRRGVGPRSTSTRIKVDDQAERLLTELGYSLASVPPQGETIYLRRNANTSDGGTAADVTDMVHPDNRAIAERAARVVGLDVAGVDILTTDISKSLLTNDGAICEINSRPGLRKHIWPMEGKSRDVAGAVIDMLMPKGARNRIRIIAVTGTGDRVATAKSLAKLLTDRGFHVGVSTDGGVIVDGSIRLADKLNPIKAARMLFLDPEVDAAVIEVSPSDVLQHGLGFDACDIGLVVNPTTAAAGAGKKATAELDAKAIKVVTDAAAKVMQLNAATSLVDVVNSIQGHDRNVTRSSSEASEPATAMWQRASRRISTFAVRNRQR